MAHDTELPALPACDHAFADPDGAGPDMLVWNAESMRAYATAAVSAERELCAQTCARMAAEMAIADAEALAMDAELKALRYLWLRDSDDAAWRPFALRQGCTPEQADALVDAAMVRSKTPNVRANLRAEGPSS